MSIIEIAYSLLAASGPPETPGMGVPEMDQAYTGAVGHLVSAFLQTYGLYAQQRILRDFAEILNHAGALFYMIAIIAAIFSVAVFGNYKKGLYLFIGPVLFFFMIEHTTSMHPTAIQVGYRLKTNSGGEVNRLASFMKELMVMSEDDNGMQGGLASAEVSWFYYFIDRIVSGVSQSVVAMLVDSLNKQDLLPHARERVMSHLMLGNITDPEYLELIVLSTHGVCAEVSRLATELASPWAQSVFEQHHQMLLTPEAATTVTPLTPSGNLGGRTLRDEGSDSSSHNNFADEYAVLMKMQQEYNKLKDKTDVRITGNLLEYLYRQLPDTIRPLVTNPEEIEGQEIKRTCQQTWEYLVAIAEKKAEEEIEGLRNSQPESDNPWKKAVAQIEATLAGDKKMATSPHAYFDTAYHFRAVKIVAAQMISNTLPKATSLALSHQVLSHTPFDSKLAPDLFRKTAATESFGGFIKIKYFAAAIPYIQGLLLYLLTVTFPFFALFLILPGNATSFVIWITLWIWVKSWDVGFAAIDIARDLLWQFVVGGVNHDEFHIKLEDMPTFFKLVIQNDPLATQNTYYFVTALLTVSVPALTAHFCLGASHMYDGFKNSIDASAERFGLQASLSARRLWGSQLEKRQDERKEHAATARALKAWREGGYEGRIQAEGKTVDARNDTADHSRRAIINALKKIESAKEEFSKDTYHDKALLAMATKRRMSFTFSDAANDMVSAKWFLSQLPNMIRKKEDLPTALFNTHTSDNAGIQSDNVKGVTNAATNVDYGNVDNERQQK